MTLLLHCGATEIDYDGLRALETPPATATHVPIPHFRLLDLVAHSVSYYGHEIVEQHHGVTEDGARYFGVLSLRSPYTGYCDMLGLRNSHDKAFPVSVGIGSRVFVCDNLAYSVSNEVKRRHTANLKRDLPGLIAEMIEPLADERERQAKQIAHYRTTDLSAQLVDHALMGMYREGIIPVTKIADVWNEWEHPSFEEFAERHNAWRLFNAATFVLNGRIAENPAVTTRLHKVIDGVCETIH